MDRDRILEERVEALEDDVNSLFKYLMKDNVGDSSLRQKSGDDFLDVWDVAKLCKVSPKTVYNWVYLGRIECTKLQGRLLFSKDVIAEYMSRHRKSKR